MFKIDLKTKKSIYEQVVDGIKEEIISGNLKTDDKLPSVRDLAGQLTVNPNTIQKAYTLLEDQGFIYSVSGRGNFISGTIPQDDRKTEELFRNIEATIKQIRYLGVSERDIRYRIMAMTSGDAAVEKKVITDSWNKKNNMLSETENERGNGK